MLGSVRDLEVANTPTHYHRLSASLVKRNDGGYHPEYNLCGTGTTCQEACGDGFQACQPTLSQETTLLCYNPDEGEICCPGGQGSASTPLIAI